MHLDRHRELAPLLLRLFLAFVLIYGTQDNVFSHERLLEFRDFLAAQQFPWPLLCAYVSVYAQFLCGIAIALGLGTRLAAAVMVVNFVVALGMVHTKLPYAQNIAPLAVLAISVALIFLGAGPWSLDGRRARTAARAERDAVAA
jgi:putative oxidoreductase